MNNKTAAEVIAEFRNERINKKYVHQQTVDALPGMSGIKSRKKKILSAMLSNSLNDLDKADLEKELHAIEKQELSLRNSFRPDFCCPKCGDTGFIKDNLCRCLRDKIYKEVYGATDIEKLGESFDTSDKSKFSTSFICKNGTTQREKYGALEKYAQKYAADFPDTQFQNILMTGKTGLGKTFILRSIAKMVHQRGADVLLISSSSLFSVFLRHRLGYDVDLELLFSCSLLLIDDLGAEPSTQNVTVEYLLDLLNKRIESNKHTIIATNLSTDDIISKYGERVYSRIRFNDLCGQMVFEGEDIRIK